ncbi:hypothetical protein DL96DRAFT_1256696 [Flagelloscypha sp. PMI_526]|nr:hypothetical protein DL96DRAFT_1256696 [Flagelloscypha sp. PMI_526]
MRIQLASFPLGRRISRATRIGESLRSVANCNFIGQQQSPYWSLLFFGPAYSCLLSPSIHIKFWRLFCFLCIPKIESGPCVRALQATTISLRMEASGTNLAAIVQIPIPTQSMTVDWRKGSVDTEYHPPTTGWTRKTILISSGALRLDISGSFAPHNWFNLACQHIPKVWSQVKGSPQLQEKALRLRIEHLHLFGLVIQADFLAQNHVSTMLYLFLKTEVQVLASGLLDLSDMFYFSFDPSGAWRLTDFELRCSGLGVTHSFYYEGRVVEIEKFLLEAILDLGESIGPCEDQTVESFLRWPDPITGRSSSADRAIRTHSPHRVHHPKPQNESQSLGHDTLCELAGGEECVCPETQLQQIHAGFPDYHDSESWFDGWKCTCFAHKPKFRRAKSVDRAERLKNRILGWITLGQSFRMTQHDLRLWYLHPVKFGYPWQRRVGANRISPWAILVNPSESERVGRPRARSDLPRS